MKILNKLKLLIEYLKDVFKNTRGIRIVKCKVDENGKKIVEFQALGSFHTEEMEYEEYRKVLIYDTEPIDVEKACIFFYANSFEKYKIYSYDPINSIIEISDKKMQNIIKITSENWKESVKYFKHMKNSDIKQIINSISSFETNNFYNSYEYSNIIDEKIQIISENETIENNLSEKSNVININRRNKKYEINTNH